MAINPYNIEIGYWFMFYQAILALITVQVITISDCFSQRKPSCFKLKLFRKKLTTSLFTDKLGNPNRCGYSYNCLSKWNGFPV